MILIDTAEPSDIEHLLSQIATVVRTPLNHNSMSDYYFNSASGYTMQFGRVQAGELLADVDSMEDELRRYYNQADRNYQIIEGIISPVPIATLTDKQMYSLKSGKATWNSLKQGPEISSEKSISSRPKHKALTFTYKVEYITDSQGVEFGLLTHGRGHNIPFSYIDVWIHRLAEAGIPTYYTDNWIETAKLLGLIYKNEQKPSEQHTTLQRIPRPRPITNIKNKDPFVVALVYLSQAYKLGIGEATAEKIAKKFVNIGDLFISPMHELTDIDGIGLSTARKILNAIGREE